MISLANFDPDRKIHNEARILQALGYRGNNLFLRGLRELAWKGERLQKRYENACNYTWANGSVYQGTTRMIEQAIFGLAHDCGLYLYIQGDPRGACVYVALEPLDEQNYSDRGIALFYGEDA